MSDDLLNAQFDDEHEFIDDSEESVIEDTSDFAHVDKHAILNLKNNVVKSYERNSSFAANETEKEWELFKFFRDCGSGRSTTYIANTFNLQLTKVQKIANKNCWAQRASDYDIDMLHEKLKVEQDSRAIEHKKRLEQYRMQQEFIGRNLSMNAAKLAALSQRTLDELLASERSVDIRDLPGILNSAAKIAEVGKNLQSGALGVEQLLVALEEADVDE